MKKILASIILLLALSACSGGGHNCPIGEGAVPTSTWAGNGQKLVVIGDSIMAGFDLALYFPSLQTLNVGMGGQCTLQINYRFNRDVLSNSPDIIVINGGINDIWNAQLSTEYLKDSIMKAKAAGVRIIVVGIYKPGPAIAHQTAKVEAWNADMVTFTTEHNIEYIDNTYDGVTAGLIADGIHLNSYGYIILAGKIASMIVP
jgi:lysophospholipase L1-like esterase